MASGLSTPSSPQAQSTTSSLSLLPAASTMIHFTLVLVAIFSISFSLGICFTITCLYVEACCTTKKQGTRDRNTEPQQPHQVPQQTGKRARADDTQHCTQPNPKRARLMGPNTLTTLQQHPSTLSLFCRTEVSAWASHTEGAYTSFL